MMEDDKYPYQKQWENYRRLLRTSLALFPVIILFFVLFAVNNLPIVKNVIITAGVLLAICVMIVNYNLISGYVLGVGGYTFAGGIIKVFCSRKNAKIAG